ncbi:hypothetical protein Vlu01_48030 [Micromonospora lutea]|uniref:Uncharacterized protein n=1 Tax=Micromonospora lutea TaxID=419825 RepID=A0ABQ4J205_9ACTN|nr:hypothetical protein Vlu01_48030 [Micromonospora lutea]
MAARSAPPAPEERISWACGSTGSVRTPAPTRHRAPSRRSTARSSGGSGGNSADGLKAGEPASRSELSPAVPMCLRLTPAADSTDDSKDATTRRRIGGTHTRGATGLTAISVALTEPTHQPNKLRDLFGVIPQAAGSLSARKGARLREPCAILGDVRQSA